MALNYLSYASTWQALAAFATALGLKLQPDQAEAIITAAIAVFGAIQLFVKDSAMEIKARLADEKEAKKP